jgi:hypothetical protein
MSFNLYDFRDLDLMLAVEEAIGDDGVSTADLAKALGLDEEAQSVAVRMAWMKRYGVFSFNEKRRVWSLTDGGNRVLEANRRSLNGSALDKVPDESMISVMAHVTDRFRRGDALHATLLRREFMFGTQRR